MPEATPTPPEKPHEEKHNEHTDGNGFEDAPWVIRIFNKALTKEGAAMALLTLLLLMAGWLGYTYITDVSIPEMRKRVELADKQAVADQERKDKSATREQEQRDREQDMRITLLKQSVDNAKENAENTRTIAALMNKVLSYEAQQSQWEETWKLEIEGQHKQRAEEAKTLIAAQGKLLEHEEKVNQHFDDQSKVHAEQIRLLQTMIDRVEAGRPKPSGGG